MASSAASHFSPDLFLEWIDIVVIFLSDGVIEIVDKFYSRGRVFESGDLVQFSRSTECGQEKEPAIVLGWGGKQSTCCNHSWVMFKVRMSCSYMVLKLLFSSLRFTFFSGNNFYKLLCIAAVKLCFVCSPETRHDAVCESRSYFERLAKWHGHEGDLSSFKLFGYDCSQSEILWHPQPCSGGK